MTKIISTQILELDKALNNFKDSKGEKVNFSKQKDSETYKGVGSDNKTYYIELKKPIMCSVSIVKE